MVNPIVRGVPFECRLSRQQGPYSTPKHSAGAGGNLARKSTLGVAQDSIWCLEDDAFVFHSTRQNAVFIEVCVLL
jgi:hypothetical protein